MQDHPKGEPSCWWLEKCISAVTLKICDVRRPSKVYQEENCRYIKLLAEAAITHQPEGQKTVTGIFISFLNARNNSTHRHTHTAHLQAGISTDCE